MAEHTALPWRVDYLDKNSQRVISGPHIEIATLWHHSVGAIEQEMEANAAFIVKAVNSHDALRASLAEMVGIYWGDGDGIEPPPACIQRAKAALASIKETSR